MIPMVKNSRALVACPAQCSCICSWTPGCWNTTAEQTFNVSPTSYHGAFGVS